MPHGLKNPPIEQKKKRGFCNYHNFLGHKTSQYVIFKDLMQKSLKEERIQFNEKPKTFMQVNVDPLQFSNVNLVEPVEFMMVEAIGEFQVETDEQE